MSVMFNNATSEFQISNVLFWTIMVGPAGLCFGRGPSWRKKKLITVPEHEGKPLLLNTAEDCKFFAKILRLWTPVLRERRRMYRQKRDSIKCAYTDRAVLEDFSIATIERIADFAEESDFLEIDSQP